MKNRALFAECVKEKIGVEEPEVGYFSKVNTCAEHNSPARWSGIGLRK